MKWLFIISFLILSAELKAQKHANNWVLGNTNILSFNTNSLLLGATDISTAVSSYSDPKTGELLFYNSYNHVYNKLHQQMPNGDKINGEATTFNALPVPHPFDSNKYLLICYGAVSKTITYSIIDFNTNNLGEITDKAITIRNNADKGFAVVKQLYDEGFWLITHTAMSKEFIAYRIGKNGIGKDSVVSYCEFLSIGTPNNTDMTTNSTGTSFTYLTYNNSAIRLGLFQFNKACGTVDFLGDIAPPFLSTNSPDASVCFSPDDSKLYVRWSHILRNGASLTPLNILKQYLLPAPISDMEGVTLAIDSIRSQNPIALGPDGRIYRYIFDKNQFFFLVIQKPNEMGLGCLYNNSTAFFQSKKPANLFTISTNLPLFVNDYAKQPPGYHRPKMLLKSNCVDTKVDFAMDSIITADSIVWHFGDGDFSTQITPQHVYPHTGIYLITLNWYKCGLSYSSVDTLNLTNIPSFNLGNDTVLCPQSKLLLFSSHYGERYVWNTGDTTNQLWVDRPGRYRVTVYHKSCFTTDEINIDYYQKITTTLGEEYTICDKDNELVKLDAGEGFVNYKWTPTSDTTQWIIVNAVNDYYVVVKDYRGCDGKDGTIVKRACPVNIFFPNAFTPNGDGINDVYMPVGDGVLSFNMSIYNRWGQLVFESSDANHIWDGTYNGKPVVSDKYLYMATYSGYTNKRLHTYSQEGNITLIR